MEGKLNALEGGMEGRMAAMESSMEELKAEVRAMTLEFQGARGRRTRKQHRSSEGSRDSVNAGCERRPPKNSKEELEEDRGEVRRSWRKRVELPTYLKVRIPWARSHRQRNSSTSRA
ncbi:hypothetical protein LR48_Vigan08g077700 [Vigna angularis]|uniref:Uncharacterized protein n=1 Tax=Phaseolus angularis TaxID=3914 RepID=A0A0L9V4J1_PHAAN|nr:hypothetical protein LR48_Vigan08g077700 [Vigna angularis]